MPVYSTDKKQGEASGKSTKPVELGEYYFKRPGELQDLMKTGAVVKIELVVTPLDLNAKDFTKTIYGTITRVENGQVDINGNDGNTYTFSLARSGTGSVGWKGKEDGFGFFDSAPMQVIKTASMDAGDWFSKAA